MIPLLSVAGSNTQITRVGFGSARIFGGSERKASARLIEAALESGIRHFDTAPLYGYGRSEAVLGEVLAGVNDVTIATKIGIPRPCTNAVDPIRLCYRRAIKPILANFPNAKAKLSRFAARNREGVPEHAPGTPRVELRDDEVLRSLEDSLKQLRRTRVDLFLLHEPDQFELTDELLELFVTLQQSGAISSFGLAYGRVATLAPAFGTIVQGRHASELQAHSDSGQTRIYHGVLRHGWHETGRHRDVRAPEDYLGRVLGAHPHAAVIFSASSPGQIRRLMRKLAARGEPL